MYNGPGPKANKNDNVFSGVWMVVLNVNGCYLKEKRFKSCEIRTCNILTNFGKEPDQNYFIKKEKSFCRF